MNSFDPQFDSQADFDHSAVFASLGRLETAAPAGMVNRTHRVVRHRARILKERRSHVRSLLIPLLVCSALLVLTVFAVWSGLYQYQGQASEAAEAVSDAVTDANDHFMVILLWFVPVSLAMLSVLWVRRSRVGARDEAR